jgi:uncharacterized damage-inducible protein DinB
MPEAWLQGPVPGVDAWLQPAAHAFLQAREDLRRAAADLTNAQLWARPGGVASVAYHLLHAAGATDRLLTYARGEGLSDAQRALLAAEKQETPGRGAEALLAVLEAAVEAALAQIRATPPATLLERREVGRDRLPSTVLGLVFHAAEHAQRHAGQATTTARLLRGA